MDVSDEDDGFIVKKKNKKQKGGSINYFKVRIS